MSIAFLFCALDKSTMWGCAMCANNSLLRYGATGHFLWRLPLRKRTLSSLKKPPKATPPPATLKSLVVSSLWVLLITKLKQCWSLSPALSLPESPEKSKSSTQNQWALWCQPLNLGSPSAHSNSEAELLLGQTSAWAWSCHIGIYGIWQLGIKYPPFPWQPYPYYKSSVYPQVWSDCLTPPFYPDQDVWCFTWHWNHPSVSLSEIWLWYKDSFKSIIWWTGWGPYTHFLLMRTYAYMQSRWSEWLEPWKEINASLDRLGEGTLGTFSSRTNDCPRKEDCI